MPRNLKTQAQLQAQINQLKQENVHLRTLLKVILDTACQAVKKTEEILYCWKCGVIIPAGHLCEDCATKEEKHE